MASDMVVLQILGLDSHTAKMGLIQLSQPSKPEAVKSVRDEPFPVKCALGCISFMSSTPKSGSVDNFGKCPGWRLTRRVVVNRGEACGGSADSKTELTHTENGPDAAELTIATGSCGIKDEE